MRVMLTGCHGLLGINLTRELVKQNWVDKVIGISRNFGIEKINMMSDVGDKFYWERGDIVNKDFLETVISKNEITHIYHLAAYSTVQKAEILPYRTVNVNVMGTANILDAAYRSTSVQRVCVSTSDKVYGHLPDEELPYREDISRFNPISSYEVTKACASHLVKMYGNLGLDCFEFRACNMFGPEDRNTVRIIPDCILSILMGTPFKIRNPDFIREFIYVKDVVKNIVRLSNIKDIFVGDAFNIGSGYHITMGELAYKIHSLMGTDYEEQRTDPGSVLEIGNQYLSIEKVKEVLGTYFVNRTVEDFDGCLRETINWYRENYA